MREVQSICHRFATHKIKYRKNAGKRLNTLNKSGTFNRLFLCLYFLLKYINSKLLHTFCIECICLQCGRDILMSETFHNSFRIYTALCQNSAVCMPQAVSMEQVITDRYDLLRKSSSIRIGYWGGLLMKVSLPKVAVFVACQSRLVVQPMFRRCLMSWK